MTAIPRRRSLPCPLRLNSFTQGVHLTATVHAKHVGEEVNASSMPLLKHPWRRRMQCTPSAEGSNCSAALPAAGLAVLQLRLQGTAAGGSPPQPCKVTVQTALAPLLLLRCLQGVWVLLFAHRALATRPGQAALRLCNAAAQAAAPWKRQLRAALAVEAVGVAVLAFLRDHIDDWPAEGRWVSISGGQWCCPSDCRSSAVAVLLHLKREAAFKVIQPRICNAAVCAGSWPLRASSCALAP